MQTTRYCKKPEVIEAVQLAPENVDEVALWCGGQRIEEQDALDSSKIFVGLNILTLEGSMRVGEGDYIIKDALGRFYQRNCSAFEATYDMLTSHGDVSPPHSH